MAAGNVQIHFVSGRKLEVPGTVAEVQDKLTSNRGATVLMQSRSGAEVAVNPEHVEYIEGDPGRGMSMS